MVPGNVRRQVVRLAESVAKHGTEEGRVSQFLTITSLSTEAQAFGNSGTPERRIARLMEWEEIVEAVHTISSFGPSIRSEHTAHVARRGNKLVVLAHKTGVVEIVLQMPAMTEVRGNPLIDR
ncbi:hypothetical protein C4U36_19675, partial [Clostridioides difficile]